jgi:hypothetical protein
MVTSPHFKPLLKLLHVAEALILLSLISIHSFAKPHSFSRETVFNTSST